MKKLKAKPGVVHDCIVYREKSQVPLEAHTHDNDELVFVFGGTGIHEIDDERYPLIRGDVFVLRGNHAHGFDETNNLYLEMVLYAHDFFDSLKKEFSELPGFLTLFILEPRYRKHHKFKAKLHLSPKELSEVSRLLKIMWEEQEAKRTGYKAIIKHLFGIVITLVCRYYSETESPKSKSLLKLSFAISFMERNYTGPVSVIELAVKAGMPESTFRHSFKKIIGVSPIDYLIRFRVEKAVEMMAENSKIKVIDAAMAVGFDNSSYFARKFKEVIGITPINYLRQQRKMVE